MPRNRLRELRLEQEPRLSQKRLGEIVQVDASTISRWEEGKPIPDETKLELAEFFGVSVLFLMGWERER